MEPTESAAHPDAERPWIHLFQSDPSLLDVPLHDSPFLERLLDAAGERGELSTAEQTQIRAFARDGFLVIDPEIDDFDTRAATIVRGLEPHYPEGSRRIQDAWTLLPEVRELAIAPTVLGLLRRLYGREPVPFQTLNFDVGTEQEAHSDTVHFHTLPRRFVAGCWIALEDMDRDNGTLFYYPGSHWLPDYDLDDLGLRSEVTPYRQYEMFAETLLKTRGLERVELEVKKGQALIWAANLFHGGIPVRDRARTRHSQVTHYYFENCLYYQPLGTDATGERCMREVVNLRTGEFVPPQRRGTTVDLATYPRVWRYPRPLPDFVHGMPRLEPS